MLKKKKGKSKNVLKPTRLIFLIVLIAANTFAWFIYATKVDTNISVHVRSWKVVFEAEDNEITNVVNVVTDSIYPGMDDYEYDISAYNRGEVAANMSYIILEARLLDDEYITVEGRGERGEQVQSGDLTSAALETQLAQDYPFTITFDVTNTVIDEEDGREDFTVSIVWPYENNQDEDDTTWGIAAYDFKEDNPTLPSIFIKVKVIITQVSS